MSNEQVYDEQISPLMAQIIKLCKEHDVPFIALFQLTDKNDTDGELFCNSCSLPEGTGKMLRRIEHVISARMAVEREEKEDGKESNTTSQE